MSKDTVRHLAGIINQGGPHPTPKLVLRQGVIDSFADDHRINVKLDGTDVVIPDIDLVGPFRKGAGPVWLLKQGTDLVALGTRASDVNWSTDQNVFFSIFNTNAFGFYFNSFIFSDNSITPSDDRHLVAKGYVDPLVAGAVEASDPTRYQVTSSNTTLNLSTSYQNGISSTFTMPTDWNTYRIKVRADVTIRSLGTSDIVDLLIQRTTSGDLANGQIRPNALPAANRTLMAIETWSGLAGDHSFAFRARNQTANAGVINMSWMEIEASRQT